MIREKSGESQINLINFTELNSEEAARVLRWRNDKRVAKFMKNKSVSEAEHKNFISNLKNDETKRYFLVKEADEYIGVIDFVDITRKSCEFGLYADPELKGVGAKLMNAIFNYAFKILKVDELRAYAYSHNASALKLYEKFGLEIYAKDEEFTCLKISLNGYNTLNLK